MLLKSIILYVLVLILPAKDLFGLTETQNDHESKLSSTISLKKNSYLIGEPIFLTLTITNIGSVIDSISYLVTDEAFNQIKVMDSLNKSMNIINYTSTLAWITYTKIEPGAEFTKTIELQEYFGSKTHLQTYFSKSCYFFEGTYTVEYADKEFTTNKLSFKVNKPSGIESEIYTKLIALYQLNESDLQDGKISYKTLDEARFDSIKEIMDNYPVNSYTEEIYSIYNRISEVNGVKEELIEKNLWFISNYPNSYYLGEKSPSYLNKILYTTTHAVYIFKNGELSVSELLGKIITDNPGTYASKLAEQLMRTKEYQK